MKTYGQFCPVAKAAELFCERWTALILRDLAQGANRFSDLRRGVPLMSPALLSHRLRQLQAEGVVERQPAVKGKGSVYRLTPAGKEFAPIVEALGVWGQRWSRRELADHEIDLKLLIWAMERGVSAGAFGGRRCVIMLTFTDQPESWKHWWFINEDGHVELCFEEPGFDVDLYLACTLRDMIYVWRGDLSLTRAVEQERLEVHGAAWARRCLPRWLCGSPFAHVKSQRREAQAA
jgi:DNA-binding HxlR family transcriptional regulator